MKGSDITTGNLQNEGGASQMAIVRRRNAIHDFLEDPADAINVYADLRADLISFFSQSTNPHIDEETGLPFKAREDDAERWERAKQWAKNQI